MSELVGVDIGSYSIKAVQMSARVGAFQLGAVGSVYNPVGQFLPSDEAQFNKLVDTLKQLATEQKFMGKPISTALPESLAYTSIISMPYLSDAELASSIHWEAEQHIPVPLEEVQLEYQILHKPKKGAVGEKMQVLLVASKKTVVDRVNELFQGAGLELVNMETGLLACYRSLHGSMPKDGGVALLNMGALSTDILIVESGKMMLSYTIGTGGLVLTRAIQQGLGLTGQQAEEYKRAYGLDESQLEGKVGQALAPVMNVLMGEIRKAFQYYQSSQMGAGIRSVILAGGGGYLRGLPGYLTQALSAEVVVANPFQGVSVDKDTQLPKEGAAYAVAVGLAGNMLV
jgi:type IV pilus assembly protein PilM